MSELQQENNETAVLTAKDEMAKTNAIIAYALLLGGFVTGISWFIGGIWAMVKKSDATGSLYEDHYNNIITTFWWSLGLSIIGILSAVIVVGYFILLGVFIWSLYRIIKGLARITSNKSFN